MNRPLAALLVSVVLAAPLAAQTGPWTDGELLVRSELAGTSTQAIYRVDPVTGNGVPLISGFFWAGHASSMVFDPFRGGVLASMGQPPSIFDYKLWLIASDGTTTSIGGYSGQFFRALTPIGDGRVYFQEVGTSEIRYLDSSDQVNVLMDSTGTSPLQFPVERMLYHAPTNALIACNSGGTNANNCTFNMTSFFSIPLSVDGSQVTGNITCSNLAVPNTCVGMDYRPGGDILVTVAGSQFFSQTLWTLDPATLAATNFASTSPDDIDGGVWSSLIGEAIILDDVANVLRTYSQGGSGSGQILTTNFPVSPSTTGVSATETMSRVDTNGPACQGTAPTIGVGLAGSSGFVPTLSAVGCPDVGSIFYISISQVLGGAPGLLVGGTTSTMIPAVGGTVYVYPFDVQIPIVAVGAGPGSGTFSLPVLLNDPAFTGFTVYLQAGFLDPQGPVGISLTNGLQITWG